MKSRVNGMRVHGRWIVAGLASWAALGCGSNTTMEGDDEAPRCKLEVTPNQLELQSGGENLRRVLTAHNAGGASCAISMELRQDEQTLLPWLFLNPTSTLQFPTELAAGADLSIPLIADPTYIGIGQFATTVAVTAPGEPAQHIEVPVALNVACTQDLFEPNEGVGEATPLDFSREPGIPVKLAGLTLCRDEFDTFATRVGAPMRMDAAITYPATLDPEDGATFLRLDLFDAQVHSRAAVRLNPPRTGR